MKKEQRLKNIISILKSHPSIHIKTLQDETGYSVSTLRRDLVDLENKGLIQRSFGAIRLLNQENLEYTWQYRNENNQNAKEKICKIAAHFVEDNDAIFIDSSTTSIRVLDYLDTLNGLKILTNNLKVAEKAQGLPNISAFIGGGECKPLSQSIIGIDANNYLGQFHARLAFISSSTIDEHGLHMADITQKQIKRTMINHSDIVIALLDHTKFSNHHNFVKLCNLDCLDYVVTDRPVEDRHILYALKENHVNIIYRKFFNN
ncbi:DeoR/GlpR family DNA-binding transcription regulator [Lactobacillus gasseri]|uniref:DeoR/GlpR family DNA-binding transcription regulator n=2 Tax=Lactobacillus gasseri TaxID=1596 RepID=UPI003B81B270